MTSFVYSSYSFEGDGNDHHTIQQGAMMVLQLEVYKRETQVLGFG